jgi:superoxide dismutase
VIELPFIDDDGELSEAIVERIEREFVQSIVSKLNNLHWHNRIKDVDARITEILKEAVDKSLDRIETRIARKKSIAELNAQGIDIHDEIRKALKEIDFTEMIDKAIARKFRG